MNFLKTTVIGGVVFLVPLVVLALVIGEAIGIMRAVAEPMARFLPVESVAGVALANVLAAVLLVLVCFLGGLLARTRPARRLADTAESAVLNRIPGYSLVKGFTSSLGPDPSAELKPVLVSLGGSARVGLEVERVGDDRVAVYFPGSPNAWSGIVQIVADDQVKLIRAPMTSVIDHAEQLGRGTRDLLRKASG